MATRQIMTVSVSDLNSFGQGAARRDGKALFIPGLSSQENTEVTVTEGKKQYTHTKVVRRLGSSSECEAPRCPHFGMYGGCQQQHISMDLQQRSKGVALVRLMKCGVSGVIADIPWDYRRHTHLGLNCLPKTQQLQVGLHKMGSSDIVDVKQCLILASQPKILSPKIRTYLGSLQTMRRPGCVEPVQVVSGALVVLHHTVPLNSTNREKLECSSHSEGLDLYFVSDSEVLGTVSGETPWYDSNGLCLTSSPRNFIRVNTSMNQKMIARVLEWPDVKSEDHVLDLLCGIGNFTLPLAA